ncbi:MAG: hypothetical protein OEZ36_05700 [Spirochaetota bacterium]|nr:hypothetical protein [Spirochaetota bacterium]
MKRFLIALFIMSIAFVNVSIYAKKSPKSLVGMWKMAKSYDLKTKKVFIPSKDVYYQFNSDGSLILTDTNVREKKVWKWRMRKGILNMISPDGRWKIKSPIRFKSSEQFVIMVNMGKSPAGNEQQYIWSFSKM